MRTRSWNAAAPTRTIRETLLIVRLTEPLGPGAKVTLEIDYAFNVPKAGTAPVMVRVAEFLARREEAKALVTGESLGQVASQTLDNLRTIDEAAGLPVLRPLVEPGGALSGMNDQLVIRASRANIAELRRVLKRGSCIAFEVGEVKKGTVRLEEAKLPAVGAPRSDSYEGEGYAILRHAETHVVEDALRDIVGLVRVELA